MLTYTDFALQYIILYPEIDDVAQLRASAIHTFPSGDTKRKKSNALSQRSITSSVDKYVHRYAGSSDAISQDLSIKPMEEGKRFVWITKKGIILAPPP